MHNCAIDLCAWKRPAPGNARMSAYMTGQAQSSVDSCKSDVEFLFERLWSAEDRGLLVGRSAASRSGSLSTEAQRCTATRGIELNVHIRNIPFLARHRLVCLCFLHAYMLHALVHYMHKGSGMPQCLETRDRRKFPNCNRMQESRRDGGNGHAFTLAASQRRGRPKNGVSGIAAWPAQSSMMQKFENIHI